MERTGSYKRKESQREYPLEEEKVFSWVPEKIPIIQLSQLEFCYLSFGTKISD